jgi:hypothetical protein
MAAAGDGRRKQQTTAPMPLTTGEVAWRAGLHRSKVDTTQTHSLLLSLPAHVQDKNSSKNVHAEPTMRRFPPDSRPIPAPRHSAGFFFLIQDIRPGRALNLNI